MTDNNGVTTVKGEVVLMDEPDCRNGNHIWYPNHRCRDCGVLDLNAEKAELVAKWKHNELSVRDFLEGMVRIEAIENSGSGI